MRPTTAWIPTIIVFHFLMSASLTGAWFCKLNPCSESADAKRALPHGGQYWTIRTPNHDKVALVWYGDGSVLVVNEVEWTIEVTVSNKALNRKEVFILSNLAREARRLKDWETKHKVVVHVKPKKLQSTQVVPDLSDYDSPAE